MNKIVMERLTAFSKNKGEKTRNATRRIDINEQVHCGNVGCHLWKTE